jgi:hypothetical protein
MITDLQKRINKYTQSANACPVATVLIQELQDHLRIANKAAERNFKMFYEEMMRRTSK